MKGKKVLYIFFLLYIFLTNYNKYREEKIKIRNCINLNLLYYLKMQLKGSSWLTFIRFGSILTKMKIIENHSKFS